MPPKIARFDTGEEPIDGYVLVEFLGRGQFGEVWKARDKASGKLVAIKIIDLTFSPTALKELRAFKLVKNLNHPNLIPIFTARLKNRRDREVDFDKADLLPKGDLKELVIAMGLGEKSLSQRLKELNPDGLPPDDRRGIPVAELIRYMRGAARGIDFLNQQDHGVGSGTGDGPIIHCDIKPENMMIVAGEVQIADCGVAVIISPDMRQTRAAGSPAYSGPELSGNKPGPGTDQYALAVSYYELRTGRLPFPDEASLQQIILAHALGDLDFANPAVSEAEQEILRRATARVPADRFETCEEFVEELAGLPDIRAAIKAARRPSSQANLPSRPSGDFDLPAGIRTPMGTGSGDLPPGPGRLSDVPADPTKSDPVRAGDPKKSGPPPRATPAKAPGAKDSGPPVRPPVAPASRPPSDPAPPKPRSGVVDFDIPAPAAEAPRPSTPSWKDLDAAKPAPPVTGSAPPARPPSGTVSFDVAGPAPAEPPQTPAPTPWLPFPPSRSVPPAPEAPAGPPPGLAATSVVPDIQPVTGTPPAAVPGLRDTTLPWSPATDTPASEPPAARAPAPPGAPGSSGMPVDPDDPLGQRYATAVPDGTIARIIAESQRVPPPPTRPTTPPPPPTAPARPAKARKPEPARPKPTPVAPPPAEEPEDASKPAWVKEVLAEEAKRKSAPIPGKKSQPVAPPPAKQSQTAQDWKTGETEAKGGSGKLIAAIAAGVIGLAGLGGGVYYFGFNKPGTPPPTSETAGTNGGDTGGPQGQGSGRQGSGGTTDQKPVFDRDAAEKRLKELLEKKDFAAARTHARDVALADQGWRDDAIRRVNAAEELVRGPEKTHRPPPSYATWKAPLDTFDPAANFAGYRDKLGDLLGESKTDPGWKLDLVNEVLAKFEKNPKRWDVWAKIKEKYPFAGRETDPQVRAVRARVAGWKAEELANDFTRTVLTPVKALAAADADENRVNAAKQAVADWRKQAADARQEYADHLPKTLLPDGLDAVIDAWSGAAAEADAGGGKRTAFAELKKLASAKEPPPLPEVVAFEYFRLGAGEPIADQRLIRDNVTKNWGPALTEGQKAALNGVYTGRLVGHVKTAFAVDKPSHRQILADTGGDPAGGWRKVVEAEDRLFNRSADGDAVARELRAEAATTDADLEKYRKYLAAVADGRKGRFEPAAAALLATYKVPPKVLVTETRRAEAVNVWASAAKGKQRPRDGEFGVNPYPGGPDGQDAVNWLRVADQQSEGHTWRGEVAMHLHLAATAQGESALAADALQRVKNVNPRGLVSRPDAEAGLAFFKRQSEPGPAAADRLAAYAGAVRCAVQVLDYARERTRTDTEDKEFAEKYVKTLADSLLEPGLKLGGDTAPSGPGRRAYSELVVWKSTLRVYDYYLDKESSLVQVTDRLTREIDSLLGPVDPRNEAAVANAARKDPELAEALACRAYATLYRFAKVKGLKDAIKPDDPDAERTWRQLRNDAEAAIGCAQAKPFLAHLTLAIAGYAEFRDDQFDAPAAFNRPLDKASIGNIKGVADHFKRACDLFGNKKFQKPTVLYYRTKYLFYAANAIAKTGQDMSLVRQYLTEAQAGIAEIEKIRADQRYTDQYLKGVILEDMAWLLRENPKDNYATALKAFKDGELWKDTIPVAKIAPADVARCTARGVMYGHMNRAALNEALAGMRSFPWDNAAPSEKAEALFWQGVLEWVNNNPDEADSQLKRVADELKRVADELKDMAKVPYTVKEFTIRAHGLRGQIAITRARRNDGGAKSVTVADEAVGALKALFTEDSTHKSFSHYSFLADYFQGWKAYQDNNKEEAAKHFREAYTAISDMNKRYELLVEEPFPLLCLATELELLGRNGLTPEDRANRVKLLIALKGRFAWSLTADDAKWIDEVVSKSR